MTVDRFLKTLIEWASGQPDIQGVALVGSYARETATAASDLDLILLTSDRSQYLEHSDWLSQFGEVQRFQRETWGAVETIRATYKNGLEVEYNFAAPSWACIPVDPGTRRVVEDGCKILFDPNGTLYQLSRQVNHVCN